MAENFVHLPADTNQALGIARFAIDYMRGGAGGGEPDQSVLERTDLFHADACLCGVSALALGTNAPTVLRNEALSYPSASGATVFGSNERCAPEKAICANSNAVREWDSNGTNFGYNPERNATAGEFGHNDFYPVAIAAAQMAGKDGAYALLGMTLIDEIRGRLAEVFSLKTYKIDHVVHGAIASAAAYGAMLGATEEQIESAIGMVVAHAIPFRAIRAGKQLSDSKGASAAISTEFAVLSMKRSMAGFIGPKDIFRNPEAIFRLFEGPGQLFHRTGTGEANTTAADASPFDLYLSRAGSDFAVMGMHFKLGLYEHQSAGAIQATLDLLGKAPALLEQRDGGGIKSIRIVAYEPAFGIIGDPAKRDPRTRQSADHSMVYIVSTLIGRALDHGPIGAGEQAWLDTMLLPHDYSAKAIDDPRTRALMDKIEFAHGGEEYDRRYPDGIPTSMIITDQSGAEHDSGLVMYPAGHARNTTHDRETILGHKFKSLATLASDRPDELTARFRNIDAKSADEIATINDFQLKVTGGFE